MDKKNDVSDYNEHVKRIVTDTYEHIETLKNYIDVSDDLDRILSWKLSLNHAYHTLALFEYEVKKDPDCFIKWMASATSIILSAYNELDSKTKTYTFTMLGYTNIFNALSAGKHNVAVDFAKVYGTKNYVIKQHRFVETIGPTIKYCLLEDSQFLEWHAKLAKRCVTIKSEKRFSGVADALLGLYNKDQKMVEAGIKEFLKVYPRSAGPGKFFGSEPEKHLCVWGLALTNWARHLGMDIPSLSPLIPENLLLEKSNG